MRRLTLLALIGLAACSTNSVHYKDCTDAWSNLGRPITKTDDGYQSKFDTDSDGVGCETKPD